MSGVSSTYAEYERIYKRKLFKLTFTVSALLCSYYFYHAYQIKDWIDAICNLAVVIISVSSLAYMQYAQSTQRINFIPALNFLVLFFGSFIGSAASPDAITLLWCMIFLPCIILVSGHIKSLPYLTFAQGFAFYVFYIGEFSWINVNYTANEKSTYMMTSCILLTIVWFAEYIRFQLTMNLHFETNEKQRMKYLSSHDELTGLTNRRGFNELTHINKFFNKRQIDQHALIMLDIDDFKAINDEYGHSFGDLALKNVARLQLATVRSSDIVVRWGGEEFLILLTNIHPPPS